jgi:bifunctional UDP-N-acetylglucosamine pyrophosphorylase / glucosamine-1-phosphate N-acetyltransferase
MRSALAVILAAGEGKRMRSASPKVLHEIGHLPMIAHVLKALQASGVDRIAVVVGPGHEAVTGVIGEFAPTASVHIQSERRGTAHAVLAARQALRQPADDIIVVFGDTPFVSAAAVSRVRDKLASGAAIAVGGMRPENPQGYGRLVEEGGRLIAIREERDASETERRIRFVNGGVMGLSGAVALDILDAIGDANDQHEFYLTDAVEVAGRRGLKAEAVEIPAEDLFGINDRAQLAEAERQFQTRRRAEVMQAGATLIEPETVFFAHDTVLGRDVVIEPNVVFGPGVTVADRARIRAFSHIEGAHIGEGAFIGPFARLRPGAAIGDDAHIGNFVEIKQAAIGAGAKVNHLSYVGDASVGAQANIGAGTITCNYDGFLKSRTEIGARAFIGSNSSLVAPVRIGDDAYVGSGSVITRDVAAGALALERAAQVEKPGWVERFRTRMAGRKKAARLG